MSNDTNKIVTRQPTALDAFKQFIRRDDIMSRFEEILGSQEARYFVNGVIVAVANNPKLLECTLASIVTAASRAAMLRLAVNDNTGQAWIIPYGKVARFQVGWKGLRDMAMEGGKVRYLNVGELYEGEYIEIDRLTGAAEFKGQKESSKVHSLFVYYQDIYGFKKTIVRTLDEIHAHAKLYNPGGYAAKDGPWQSNKPRTVRGMEQKTILTEMINAWVPLDPYKKKIINTYEQMPDEDLSIVEAQFRPEPLLTRQSAEEIVSDLGYEAEPVSRETLEQENAFSTTPADPNPYVEVPALTYEKAATVLDSHDKPYAEMTDAQLAQKIIWIQRAIEKAGEDFAKRSELQYKLSAVFAIQLHRQGEAA